jgi:hypothetical protein
MLGRDVRGRPILFANVPNAGVSKVDANARSGNKLHDAHSGKFGAGGSPDPKKPAAPANADPHQYARMMSTIREASRKFPELDENSIADFLKERAKSPDQIDIAQFMQAIRAQQINDLVDVLADRLNQEENGVILSSTDEFRTALVGSLTPDEIALISNVLESKGFEPDEIKGELNAKAEVDDKE